MRFTILFLVCVLCSSLLFGAENELPALAVLAFKYEGITEVQSILLRDDLGYELEKSGVVRVIERERLDDLLKEQGLQLTDSVDTESAIDIGKLAGANYVVLGTVGIFSSSSNSFLGTETEDYYLAVVRVVDVESGDIVASSRVKEDMHNFDEIAEHLSKELVKGLSQLVQK